MKRLVPVALGAGLLIAISGCDAVQEVQQTADQVGNAATTAQSQDVPQRLQTT